MDYKRAGILLVAILLAILDTTHASCRYVGWTSKVPKCPKAYKHEAYQERQEANGRTQYVAVCCSDHESQSKERSAIMQCRTTECIPASQAGRNNSCSHLRPVYIDKERFSPDYEEVLRESCDDGQVSGVCCPRNTYSALHMSISAAEQNEFPHMAALPGCGGTVYNKDYVITAAHCLVDSETGHVQDAGDIQVRIGTNMGSKDASGNIYNVEEILVHEEYSQWHNHSEFGGMLIYNDIALLKLARSIDFAENPNIRVLELAPEDFHAEDYADNVVIAGWGTSELLSTTQHLQKSNLKIRTDSECFDRRQGKLGRHQYAVLDHADQLLCVGGMIGDSISNEAGRGDSGGPAVCRGPNGYGVLCGVTSFGSAFAEEDCVENQNEDYCQPSVYADVGFFRRWIEERAGEQEEEYIFRPILYGEEVLKGEYTNQVHVRAGDGKVCGGTLVSEDTVVTGAHCVVDDEGTTKHPVVVETIRDVSQKAGKKQTFRAKSVARAAGFGRYENLDSLNNTRAENRLIIKDLAYKDDVAVLKLASKVNIPKSHLPELPKSSDFKPGKAIEVAFPTDATYGGGLRKREFNILSKNECKKRLDRFRAINVNANFDTSKVMCAVETYSGGGICDRELGGGLMCKGKGGKFNVFCGIQTFRLCETTLPSAFFNVGKQVKLIEKFMAMK